MRERHLIGSVDEIPQGRGKRVKIGGRAIAVLHATDGYYAIDDGCLHRGGSLSEGEVSGTTVTCPLHGWRWDLPSGGHMFSPLVRLSTYPVEVLEGKIYLVASAPRFRRPRGWPGKKGADHRSHSSMATVPPYAPAACSSSQ